MSLSFRLNLLIVFTFVLILLPSTALIVMNTREAVSKELESSAELALQLLTAATLSGSPENAHKWRLSLVRNLNQLSKIRHLNIAIRGADDKPIMPIISAGADAIVPWWFSDLVVPDPQDFRQRKYLTTASPWATASIGLIRMALEETLPLRSMRI